MQLGGAAYLNGFTINCYGCYFTGNTASSEDVYIRSGTLSTKGSTNCEESNSTLSTNDDIIYGNYNCGGTSAPTMLPSSSLASTQVPTLEPTAVPSALPSSLPTLEPTAATEVKVSTEAELTAAIANNAYITLGNDIELKAGGGKATAFTIDQVTGLTIDGAGYTLGFASSLSTNGRIFYISGGASVTMVDLTLANGYQYTTDAYGGAIIIADRSTLEMTSCTLYGNTLYVSLRVTCICSAISPWYIFDRPTDRPTN